MLRFVLVASIITAAYACSSSSNSNNFPTFQACYNEHTTNEGFGPLCATEICCIDHGIGSAMPDTVCGATAQTCESYVDANLQDTSSDPGLMTDVMMACTFYVHDGQGGSGSSSGCGS